MVDNSTFKQRDIIMLNISTLEKEDLQEWVAFNVDAIFKEDPSCASLVAELVHCPDPETGKKKLQAFIKTCYKACGFKWKMMKSANGRRTTVYGTNRNKELYPFQIIKYVDISNPPSQY